MWWALGSSSTNNFQNKAHSLLNIIRSIKCWLTPRSDLPMLNNIWTNLYEGSISQPMTEEVSWGETIDATPPLPSSWFDTTATTCKNIIQCSFQRKPIKFHDIEILKQGPYPTHNRFLIKSSKTPNIPCCYHHWGSIAVLTFVHNFVI